MRRGLRSMGEVIGSSGKGRTGMAKSVAMAAVASAWEEHMRGKFGCESSVSSINDGVVFISVAEPVWAQQMSMLKREILKSLAEHCDTSSLKDIRFSGFGDAKAGRMASSRLRGEECASGNAPGKDDTANGLKGSRREVRAETARNRKRCPVCGENVRTGEYCPVCAGYASPRLAARAVDYLMESPFATDDEVNEVCGLEGLEALERYEVVQYSREVAGRRLLDEAIRAASAPGDADAGAKRAKALLIGSACASTGKSSDEVISRGLGSFFPSALLEAAGQGKCRA